MTYFLNNILLSLKLSFCKLSLKICKIIKHYQIHKIYFINLLNIYNNYFEFLL